MRFNKILFRDYYLRRMIELPYKTIYSNLSYSSIAMTHIF